MQLGQSRHFRGEYVKFGIVIKNEQRSSLRKQNLHAQTQIVFFRSGGFGIATFTFLVNAILSVF
jgi:hypothetical protein